MMLSRNGFGLGRWRACECQHCTRDYQAAHCQTMARIRMGCGCTACARVLLESVEWAREPRVLPPNGDGRR